MRRIDARVILAVWRSCRESGINVFTPGVAGRLGSLPGWSSLGIPEGDEPRALLLEGIRSLELLARETPSGQGTCELVVSHPAPVNGGSRSSEFDGRVESALTPASPRRAFGG